MGFSADAITHMGYFIPIDRIYELLKRNDYNFIYDDSYDIGKCMKRRTAKQKDSFDEIKKEKDDD